MTRFRPSGFRPRPLLDEDGEPTTRAALLSAERLGDTGYAESRREQPVDRVERATLVEELKRLQRGVRDE